MTRMHNPPHPGRILKEALENIPMTAKEFAAAVEIPEHEITEILEEKIAIRLPESIMIAGFFNQTPEMWFKMSKDHYDWQATHP